MWYEIEHVEAIDSPALLVYRERVLENIRLVKSFVGDVSQLRPHVKTHKIREVAEMMLAEGIAAFKASTIAEVEMLCLAGARDVLLAYQPTETKAVRLRALRAAYPNVRIACLVDNEVTARMLSKVFEDCTIAVFIDLNVGMNRTGVSPEGSIGLNRAIHELSNIYLQGIHAYDGHIHDTDLVMRRQKADQVFQTAHSTLQTLQGMSAHRLQLVLGGTPTFALHAEHDEVQVSPGTFVFWDEGYATLLPDLPFGFAAVLLTRIISIIDEHTVCFDLGHKSVAAENPLPRVQFLNLDHYYILSQSEEHLVVKVLDSGKLKVGAAFYAVPVHICPTVALYEQVYVVENRRWTKCWKVIARDRSIVY